MLFNMASRHRCIASKLTKKYACIHYPTKKVRVLVVALLTKVPFNLYNIFKLYFYIN